MLSRVHGGVNKKQRNTLALSAEIRVPTTAIATATAATATATATAATVTTTTTTTATTATAYLSFLSLYSRAAVISRRAFGPAAYCEVLEQTAVEVC